MGLKPLLPFFQPSSGAVPAELVPDSDLELDDARGSFLGKAQRLEVHLAEHLRLGDLLPS